MNFKLLGAALLSATVLLTACGQNNDKAMKDENKKSETKSDKKTNDPKKDKQSKKDKKKEHKMQSKEEALNQSVEQNTNQQQSTEQTNQQTQQQNVQTQDNNRALTKQQMEANAKVAKQNGYTGIPNGDMGGVPTSEKSYSNDQLDPETGLPKDGAVPKDSE
ncbi:hypothetical protein [Staphylococcus warneri]|uniref:hypothetical protein n=1 Tax=Staphylococcus warneri TaxID=1292 RepID=UPI000D1FA596|nr:hypothetical protein [Staphylococcus warneri]PTI07741.1 hypothetical protein BU087_07915 [Staphylococcus warneri]